LIAAANIKTIMKKFILPLLGLLFIVGCVSPTPVVTRNASGIPVATNNVITVDTNRINAGIAAAQGVNAATAPFNPYAPLVSPVVSEIGALVFLASSIYAGVKNKQKGAMLAAVVQGVEGASPPGANDTTPITLAAVKQSIQASATAAGVQPALHAVVVNNT
jgi:hypothetical protein